AGGQADTAAHRGGEVGDDIAEQVVGDDHVEAGRVVDHMDGGGVDVLVGDLDVGELGAHRVHRALPQRPGEGQDVGLVHEGEVFAPGLRLGEGVADHTFDTEPGVGADLGGDLVRGVDPDSATGARVGALGALADDHEIDIRATGEGAADARVQLGGPQVDVMVEREPGAQQQAAFEEAAGHRRVADRAEQDRVVLFQFRQHRFRQDLAGGVVALGAEIVFGTFHAGQHHIEYFERLGDDLRADTVTGDHGELHDNHAFWIRRAASRAGRGRRAGGGRRWDSVCAYAARARNTRADSHDAARPPPELGAGESGPQERSVTAPRRAPRPRPSNDAAAHRYIRTGRPARPCRRPRRPRYRRAPIRGPPC